MVDDCNLHDIAGRVLTLCESINKNVEVKLVNGVKADLPKFKCDADRLAQIINNLVNNAIKFTFVGSITVSALIKVGRVELCHEDEDFGRCWHHLSCRCY